MSLSAALVLATAVAAPAHDAAPSHGVVLATARATAEILPVAIVRQASGLQQGDPTAPRPQISRRGKTVLVEFQ